GTTYPILRVLRPGEPVREQGWVWIGEEKWLHVRLSDGTTGWVRSDLLERP
ncbi:SH3 domain-containing protein, partial [Thermoflexus hugenholtzii]